jgi:uncharacterized protein (UPF0261 family)
VNILDKLEEILAPTQVIKGFMPADPDDVVALFEYQATPPSQFYGRTDFTHNVQVRCRSKDPAAAYAQCEAVANALNRYHDQQISIIQASPVLDLGKDGANQPRREYTINLEIRRY